MAPGERVLYVVPVINRTPELTLDFAEVLLKDRPRVGGQECLSLGELFRSLGPLQVGVLGCFATTAAAYRRFLGESGLE